MSNRSTAARRVKTFEDAVRTHEMKGSMHPDDWAGIEQDYRAKRKALVEYITALLNSLDRSMPI
jgi:hypothetical protein